MSVQSSDYRYYAIFTGNHLLVIGKSMMNPELMKSGLVALASKIKSVGRNWDLA